MLVSEMDVICIYLRRYLLYHARCLQKMFKALKVSGNLLTLEANDLIDRC